MGTAHFRGALCPDFNPSLGTNAADLSAALQQLKAQGVQGIVTALNFAELAEADVGQLLEQVKVLDFHLPIIAVEASH